MISLISEYWCRYRILATSSHMPRMLLGSSKEAYVNNCSDLDRDIQIFGCSGVMFALNSSLLLLYRMLEKAGRLSRVTVERVSLDKIPASLLSRVTTPSLSHSLSPHNQNQTRSF